MTGHTENTVTLQEAAEMLGVHYMTAYRYVRLGLLPAHKEGTTWRLERADLDTFRTDASQPVGGGRGHHRAPWAERLEDRLLAGDGRGAWGVVEAALAAGTDVRDLYLEVVAPAMTSIGERWAMGEIDIAVEHRASGIVMRLLGRLGPRFTRRGRTRGAVVLGAPVGEHHSLPVALVADLVGAAGFEVSDLGANVPADSFRRLVVDMPRLVAVGVSVTNAESLDEAARTVAVLRTGTGATTPILVGGYAVRDEQHARALGADAYAADGRTIVALLDELTGRRPAVDVGSDARG